MYGWWCRVSVYLEYCHSRCICRYASFIIGINKLGMHSNRIGGPVFAFTGQSGRLPQWKLRVKFDKSVGDGNIWLQLCLYRGSQSRHSSNELNRFITCWLQSACEITSSQNLNQLSRCHFDNPYRNCPDSSRRYWVNLRRSPPRWVAKLL